MSIAEKYVPKWKQIFTEGKKHYLHVRQVCVSICDAIAKYVKVYFVTTCSGKQSIKYAKVCNTSQICYKSSNLMHFNCTHIGFKVRMY